MKKNPQKNTTNKPVNKPASKGIGFGDALFAMKDLQGDYTNVSQPSPIQPPPIMEPPKDPTLKQSYLNKSGPKPVKKIEQPKVVRPATIVKKQEVVQKSSEKNMTDFRIAPGKEFTKSNKVEITPLKCLDLQNNIHELSIKNIPNKCEYYVFCEGLPAKELVPMPEVSFNFNLEDIKQGNLGNCYFICALASIAHLTVVMQQRIPKFKEYRADKEKSFLVGMFQSGKYVEMPVDNSFPGIYCKPAGNDITPMILEKAFAQLYGNFDIIKMGHASDALRDLTGAPTYYIDIKIKDPFRKNLIKAFENKEAIVIASKKEVCSDTISPQHSYNVLDFDQIAGDIFLKLRDPRGWTKAQFKIPGKLSAESEIVRGNGIFWIGHNDLKVNFQVISSCKVQQHNSYFFKTFSQKQLSFNNSKTGGILITVNKLTTATFSIHQKHKKHFDQKYKYDIIRILISEVKFDGKQLKLAKTIKTAFNAQQACTIEVQNLSPGTYMLLGQIGNNLPKPHKLQNERFTLTMYSDTSKDSFEFSQVDGPIKIQDYVLSYIRNNKQEFQETITDKGLQKYFGDCFGYVCIYYENQGLKNVIEEIQYLARNVEITEKKVQLKPKDRYVIMNPIGYQENCSHACSTKTKTYYK